jgi:molybdopterin-guanine dinucleotide biosynthesis protein A
VTPVRADDSPEAAGPSGPLGVVLAGGAALRLGGAKATAVLGGRPLTAWVLAALRSVVGEAVVVGKPETKLPPLGDEPEVWREPASPLHPLAGIAWALERAGGRALLVCAVDLPFCEDALRAVVGAGVGARAGVGVGTEAGVGAGVGVGVGAPIVIAAGQPLLGIYRASVGAALREAVAAGRPARATVGGLDAVSVAVPDPERTLFNVNTAEDLARAEAMVAGVRTAGASAVPPPWRPDPRG